MLAIGAATALALTSCGSSGASDPPATTTGLVVPTVAIVDSETVSMTTPTLAPIDDDTTGWVAGDASGAIYLSYVEGAGASLSGLVQLASLSADGLSVNSNSDSVAGTLSGHAMSLDVFGESWVGELRNDVLALTYARPDGTLGQMRLVPGSLDDYNAYVSSLKGSMAVNVDISVAEATQAAETANVVALFGATNSARSDLDFYVSQVPDRQTEVESALDGVVTAADDAREDFDDCDTLEYSLETVEYAVEGVSYAAETVDYSIETIRGYQQKATSAADRLDLVADSDDTAYAVYSAEQSVVAADAAIALAIAQYDESLDAANATLASVGAEAKTVCPGIVVPPPVTTVL